MTLENEDIIQKSKKNKRCYPLVLVGAVIADGSVSNLLSGGVCRLYSQIQHILSLVVSERWALSTSERIWVKPAKEKGG